MEFILLFLIACTAGALGSLIGLGGGVIIVPALLFFGSYTPLLTEISPQVAVGTSLVIMIFTGLASTLAYRKHGTIDIKSGLLFFAASGPGGIVGAWVNQYLNVQQFNIYFGLFMIFMAILLMVRNRLKPLPLNPEKSYIREFVDGQGNKHVYGYRISLALLIAFFVGFASGLFGIGGGSVMVPAMILLFAFPPHVAVATSMLMILLSSLLSSGTHISLGNVQWLFTVALIPGAWVGAKLGALLNSKLKSDMLVAILRIVLVLLGIRMIYQGIIG
ncbi:sulfite exporter TauE/SafE family protein [Mangrovibacillus cuniculi]|uniref:Probable membrane transporter protein n=1 Tax=Mangrovibacillus cuniculi TaxID=2593652 RepID=A0A7S8CCE3_9BACI|nr:sulfite exporter TauE/SafE family protein [Mangrovibacillus cuniculi]QPC47394.1 sulfite exporter TauE/SafE family protein [Mangrovibacillus cuniculi]